MICNADEVLSVACEAHRAGRTVVFDLDNTLYPETSFLDQAYAAFAEEIARAHDIDPLKLADFMQNRFRTHGRIKLLDDVCSLYNLPLDCSRTLLLHCLRERQPACPLLLFQWAADFLRQAPDLQGCAVITNGNVQQQRNKIMHMPQLQTVPEERIVFANAYMPKPAPDAARYLERTRPCKDPLYIGDAASDEAFARAAGWSFFQIDFKM